MKIVKILAFAAFLTLLTHGAFAQTAQNTQTSSDDKWTTTPSIYLWLTGMHGDVGTAARQASVHASPWEVLSHFRFGIMAEADIRHGRFIAPVDLVWARLGEDKSKSVSQSVGASAKVKLDEVVFTPKMGYRVIDQKVKVDGLVGFRYWHIGSTLAYAGPLVVKYFDVSQNWMDPLVGGRITVPLSPKAEFVVAGDVGGWGAGSELDYQVVGLLGYQVKPKLGLLVGWKYLDVNRRTTDFVFDMAQTGAFVGFTFGGK
jgi:hypothetical protein